MIDERVMILNLIYHGTPSIFALLNADKRERERERERERYRIVIMNLNYDFDQSSTFHSPYHSR